MGVCQMEVASKEKKKKVEHLWKSRTTRSRERGGGSLWEGERDGGNKNHFE